MPSIIKVSEVITIVSCFVYSVIFSSKVILFCSYQGDKFKFQKMTTQKNKIAELERFLAKEKEQHVKVQKKIQNQKKKGNMLPTEEIVLIKNI